MGTQNTKSHSPTAKEGIMKLNDLVGKRFGMLVVISRADDAILSSGRKITAWKCICDCGSYTTVMAANLTSGHTRSCGCIAVKHGYARKERLYNIWVGMKQRCRDKNTKDYPHYGGRGIRVCAEWQSSYPRFRNWALSNGYRDSLTIDRIDVNGDYCPENCRWITIAEQNRNTTRSRRVPA